ncbi:hypothetical protein [Methylobacterium sp. WL64]|uniref:hypothetical protein n=1 Tax=Methylobacterium sp. WL64 TaxID=2603894 RepID=UPI001FED3A03|nr:hypothetical protein [Methylobacterium sp. WL64]
MTQPERYENLIIRLVKQSATSPSPQSFDEQFVGIVKKKEFSYADSPHSLQLRF